ncbi:NUDIX domain-containing protein, partial [Streptococcus pneumoniae]|nr:NUDIX domain-containing protein [Streptococcus pneumoniae]
MNIAGEGSVVFGVKYEEAKGKYVAEYFGGKVEPEDADPRETALRELKEETGLVVGRDDLMGPVVTSKGDFG